MGKKLGLIARILSGVILLTSVGCASIPIKDYRDKPVGQTTAEAFKSTARSYDKAGKNFVKFKPQGLFYIGEGLVKTVASIVTGVNDLAELVVGGITEGLEGATARIPGVNSVTSAVDGLRQTTFDSTFGGESFNNSFNIGEYGRNPAHFFTNDYEAAANKHGDNQGAVIADGTLKTIVRFGSIYSIFLGGGEGGEGGEGAGAAGPGPFPPSP